MASHIDWLGALNRRTDNLLTCDVALQTGACLAGVVLSQHPGVMSDLLPLKETGVTEGTATVVPGGMGAGGVATLPAETVHLTVLTDALHARVFGVGHHIALLQSLVVMETASAALHATLALHGVDTLDLWAGSPHTSHTATLTFTYLTLVGLIRELRPAGHPLTAVHAVDALGATVPLHGVTAGDLGALPLPTCHVAMTTCALLTHIEDIEEVLAVTITLTRVEAAVTRGATVALGGV